MAWRILSVPAARWAFWAAASSLRVRGVLARARAAASASLRDGVGRPLPLTFPGSAADSSSVAGVSDLLRRNTVRLLVVLLGAGPRGRHGGGRRRSYWPPRSPRLAPG